MTSRVSVKSDGTGVGTQILVDGKPLENCDECIIRIMPTGLAQVTLRLFNVPIDLDGQVVMDFRGKGKPPQEVVDLHHSQGVEVAQVLADIDHSGHSHECGCTGTVLHLDCSAAGCEQCRNTPVSVHEDLL